jgi:hypothetical protein
MIWFFRCVALTKAVGLYIDNSATIIKNPISKNHMGETDVVELYFNAKFCRFEEWNRRIDLSDLSTPSDTEPPF